jgi:hypothetical protein
VNFYLRWAGSTMLGTHYLKKFCPLWDAALNRLIDKHWRDVKVDGHVATLGDTTVWVSNAFYAYGYCWNRYGGHNEFRPSLQTMRRLDSLVRHIQGKREADERAKYLQSVKGLGL